jgi:hypothetical protein
MDPLLPNVAQLVKDLEEPGLINKQLDKMF